MYSAAFHDEYVQKMENDSTVHAKIAQIKRMINPRARRFTQCGRDKAVYPLDQSIELHNTCIGDQESG